MSVSSTGSPVVRRHSDHDADSVVPVAPAAVGAAAQGAILGAGEYYAAASESNRNADWVMMYHEMRNARNGSLINEMNKMCVCVLGLLALGWLAHSALGPKT